ncbi:hypothetical protein SBF1_4550002 [Candidatus Desulfosporosinus infrequens]|uniref:Uncharacterized protein n=1 Tax=Candidatus Desulfosporosinus infrequens TaxID=2043169 RepID=A0A2U3LCI6_9FIRM|nr:hypothetical protein SBF1_4550002 [Candidatus Desulfosporosinus infrequens]
MKQKSIDSTGFVKIVYDNTLLAFTGHFIHQVTEIIIEIQIQ